MTKTLTLLALVLLPGGSAWAEDSWQVLMKEADRLSGEGRYLDAKPALERALRIAEGFGPLDFRLSGTLNAAGLNEHNLGNFAEAERFYRRAIAIADRHRGSPAHLLAGILTNMGLLYKVQGQHGKAEKHYQRALALMDREYGADSVESTGIRSSLASVYVWSGRPERALPLLQEVLAVLEGRPEKEADIALAQHHLGMASLKAGRQDEARRLVEGSLELMGKLLPSNHPGLIEGQVNLAIVRIKSKDFAGAESLLLESIRSSVETLGPGHPLEAHIRSVYAGLLQRTKRKVEARSMMRQAEEMYGTRRSLRSRHSVDVDDLLIRREEGNPQ